MQATPVSGEQAPHFVRQRLVHRLVVEGLGPGERVAAARDGVARVAAGRGDPDVATRLAHELGPGAVRSARPAHPEALQICDELLTLAGQTGEGARASGIHELALVQQRAFVIHTSTDQLPEDV